MDGTRDSSMNLTVIKRSGKVEEFKYDKIYERIRALAQIEPKLENIDISLIVAGVKEKCPTNGISTSVLDQMAASVCDSEALTNPTYHRLAGRILVSNVQKSTGGKFSTWFLQRNREHLKLNGVPYYAREIVQFVEKHGEALDQMIVPLRDFMYSFNSMVLLENTYLDRSPQHVYQHGVPMYKTRGGDKVAENNPAVKVKKSKHGTRLYYNGQRLTPLYESQVNDTPQYMWMRVALAVCVDPRTGVAETATEEVLAEIKRRYDSLSLQYYTHATPTLLNACKVEQQLCSCFLATTEDSSEDIMELAKSSALISRHAGGLGIHLTKLRATGSIISTSGGAAAGVPLFCELYEKVAKIFNQGGRRNGSFAIYMDIWHNDLLDFLELRSAKNPNALHGLFYGIMGNNLFAKRLKAGGIWSLFDPKNTPGLVYMYDGMPVCSSCGNSPNPDYNSWRHLFGAPKEMCPGGCDPGKICRRDAFTELYEQYEESGVAETEILAEKIATAINNIQRESGQPYMLNKDAINFMSNQENIGTILMSNLCTEIVEYSNKDSTACCTLASINLKRFVRRVDGIPTFDHELLISKVREVVRGLDNIVDFNCYPVAETKKNAEEYRPIGVGVQGLAETFHRMGMPYNSPEAEALDRRIFETIYFAALKESAELARERGPYSKFKGSPLAAGKFHFERWAEYHNYAKTVLQGTTLEKHHDWEGLRPVVMNGVRNSLSVCLMPTASTSLLFENTESFEPFGDLIYTRVSKTGKQAAINMPFVEDMMRRGWWTEELLRAVADSGTIKHTNLPVEVKALYRTVWDIRQSELMKRMSLRQAFVDQSASLNLYLTSSSPSDLMLALSYGFALGLKTNNYYIRARAVRVHTPVKLNLSVGSATAGENTEGEGRKEIAVSMGTMLAAGEIGTEKNDDGCLMCGS